MNVQSSVTTSLMDVMEQFDVLEYFTQHKGRGLHFMKMEEDSPRASHKCIIAKNLILFDWVLADATRKTISYVIWISTWMYAL